MSIASEITRLQGVKSNILDAIAAKGVSVPSGAKLADCPELIGDIGGSSDTITFTHIEAFLSVNYDPDQYKYVKYEVLDIDNYFYSDYYIGGVAAAPCKNNGVVGCVIGANSAGDFSCAGSYIREWSASEWNMSRFYMYTIPNLTYPLKVELIYRGNNQFQLYLNDNLYLTLNNIDVSVWNRSRLLYMGPGPDTTVNKLKVDNVVISKYIPSERQ